MKFKKGNIPWNKGKRYHLKVINDRLCKFCGNSFKPLPSQVKTGYGIFCSLSCSRKYYNQNQKGENNGNWKGGISKDNMRYRRKFVKENPEIIKCHKRFHQKIRSGKIKRGNCIICNKPNAQGHHEDYSKPYDVIWFCSLHHNQYSAGKIKLKEIKNGKNN